MAGAAVLVAGLALGIKAATGARDEEDWLAFLGTAAAPMGIGFLALVSAEALRGGEIWRDALKCGWLVGLALMAAGLTSGLWMVISLYVGGFWFDGFWVFVRFATLPMGIGFLVLIAVEALRADGAWRGALKFGWLAGLAVIASALGLGVWGVTNDHPGVNGFYVFLILATTPMGVGVLIFVSVVALGKGEGWRHAAVLARIAGIAVVVAAMVLSIWAAVEIDESEFWVFLLFGTTSLGFGLLVLAEGPWRSRLLQRFPGSGRRSATQVSVRWAAGSGAVAGAVGWLIFGVIMLAIETETHEDAVWIFTFGTVVWAVGGSIIGWIAGPFGSAVSTTIGRCGVGLAIGAFVGAVLATFAGLVNGVVADDIDVAAVARGLAIAGVVGGAFIGAASGGFSTGKPGAGSS